MSDSNSLQDQVTQSCFDIVMQNMSLQQLIEKTIEYMQADETLRNIQKDNLYLKAHKRISILINDKELKSIWSREQSKMVSELKDISEGLEK